MYENSNFLAGLDSNWKRQLALQGRVFCTTTQFTREDAAAANPYANIDQCFDNMPGEHELTFGGYLVTIRPNDFTEAAFIAAQRGFGEKIEGVLSLSDSTPAESEPAAAPEKGMQTSSCSSTLEQDNQDTLTKLYALNEGLKALHGHDCREQVAQKYAQLLLSL